MAFDLDDDELRATRKDKRLDNELDEDKEIKDFLEFIKVAGNTCKEKGKHYEFVCPICGKKAEGIRNNYNGHLWAKCKNCDMSVIQ